jgi:hypothetical protein
MFGYQFDTTISISLEYNQKTHDQKKLCTLATSFSADICTTASSRDGDMTYSSLHPHYESTVGSEIATVAAAEPETDPAFYHDNCLTICCTIGSQFSKKGPNAGPVVFGSTLDRISAKYKIEAGPDDVYRQFGAILYENNMQVCPAIPENTIDSIEDAVHTMDAVPCIKPLNGNIIGRGLLRVNDVSGDQSTDFRVRMTEIPYDSRAAFLGIYSPIGGCVSTTATTTTAPMTTTTSTNTAPTTTTTRQQQLLLAVFLSGG